MDYFALKSISDLDSLQQKVVQEAIVAIDTSYSPYSKFAVGAALLLDNGSIITGSNQENMAYPSGTCAERAALFAFGSKGISNKITKLAVFAKFQKADEYASGAPCGACRQVMLEYELKQGESFEVIFFHDNQYIVSRSAQLLLPYHFLLP